MAVFGSTLLSSETAAKGTDLASTEALRVLTAWLVPPLLLAGPSLLRS